MNALLKHLKGQAPANMNGCAYVLQSKAFRLMLLDKLHHDLETDLVCAVSFFP